MSGLSCWSPVEDGIDDDQPILYSDPRLTGLYDWTKKKASRKIVERISA
jgi:hypothetical protein